MNGSHRMEGILILKGPSIIKGKELSGASLRDLSPTILYLLGGAIPSDMDGQVVREAFQGDFLKSNPIHYEKTIPEDHGITPRDLTPKEEEKLQERLKGLGYF